MTHIHVVVVSAILRVNVFTYDHAIVYNKN